MTDLLADPATTRYTGTRNVWAKLQRIETSCRAYLVAALRAFGMARQPRSRDDPSARNERA